MLTIILSVLFVVCTVNGRDICYPESGLGCFTNSKPFGSTLQRPVALLPKDPKVIGTTFTLYSRLHPDGTLITSELTNDVFNAQLKSKFLTHGVTLGSEFNEYWLKNTREVILENDDVNVVIVDWSKGNGLPFTQATANTQVVGREIAKLINSLCEKTQAKAEDFHLIGHSLGAHISGYAGERLKNFYKRDLGRITGLDAAGPYFENTDPIVRLDPTDANFVDAIHTDGTATLQLGLGIFQTVGHVDYYPNGGLNQPECPKTSDKILNALFSIGTLDVPGIEDGVACSHNSAVKYFTDSIKNVCKYNSYPCDTKEDFDAGKCLVCKGKGCNNMGYWGNPSKGTGRLFLNTQSTESESFCMQNYRINLFSNDIDGHLQTRGTFKFYFITDNHQSSVHVLDNSDVTFKKDSVEQRLISLKKPLFEEINTVFISFELATGLLSSLIYWDKWSFRYIEIFRGDEQSLHKFCPYTDFIENGSTVRFDRC